MTTWKKKTMPNQPVDWDEIEHFEPSEFDHPDEMEHGLLARLDAARELAGVSMVINSDYREDSTTTHGLGQGVDISCTRSRDRYRMLLALMNLFHRVGIYDRHIHVDIGREEDGFPPQVIWWGTSS